MLRARSAGSVQDMRLRLLVSVFSRRMALPLLESETRGFRGCRREAVSSWPMSTAIMSERARLMMVTTLS